MGNILLWVLSLAVAVTICCGQAQTGPQCVACSSTTFLDTGYSDLVTLFENHDCEQGVGPVIQCDPGFSCSTIIGIETQNFIGYGNIDLHVVIRSCRETASLGITGDECLAEDRHEDVLAAYDYDDGNDFVEFNGEVCYCNDDACNNVAAPPVVKPFRPHTPPPNAPGMQCQVCSHLQFHDDVLDEPLLENPDCEDGNLASENVNYITCFEGSVCVGIRGERTYSSGGCYLAMTCHSLTTGYITRHCQPGLTGIQYELDFKADVFERRCQLPYEPVTGETGCLDESTGSEGLADYYSFIDDITFEGAICYCTSSLCSCDPRTCSEDTLACVDFEFCTGDNERCVDGAAGPRCECVGGYGRDAAFACQPIAVSCITCSSHHFVSDVTSRTDLEDIACEGGVGVVYSCPPDAVCATVVGTEVRYYEGYGNTTINVVKRGCEYRNLFEEDMPCLSDPRSGDILNIENDAFPRVAFTGEACYCESENCNGELKDIQRVIRPDHPGKDVPGLQCVSCYSRLDANGTETQGDAALMRSCLDGDLTDPGVFYDTCPPDYVCMKLQGNYTYFIGAAFTQASVVERRCLPKQYTSGDPEGCLIMDEIKDNLQTDYSSYYFYFDTIAIDAPACYCSADVCNCDIQECLVQDLTCESDENLCTMENEYCSDTVDGPECLCVEGYDRNSKKRCQRIETCETTSCPITNSECVASRNGPKCVCEKDYVMNVKAMKCVSTLDNTGNTDRTGMPGDNGGAVEILGSHMLVFLLLAVTSVCMVMTY